MKLSNKTYKTRTHTYIHNWRW